MMRPASTGPIFGMAQSSSAVAVLRLMSGWAGGIVRLATLELPAAAEDALGAAWEDTREEDADNAFSLLDEAADNGSAVESGSDQTAEGCESASDEGPCDKSSADEAGKDDSPSIRVVTLAITWAVSGTKGGTWSAL